MPAILCAIYTRLSKEDEYKRDSESESIQNQKAMLLACAAQRGWEVYGVYCDEDYSGADSRRPDFNRMLRDARAGKFQIILCKSQARFTRDMALVEKYIHGLFPVWGIRFIALADNADTETRGNKKARQINGLVNEWYLEDLSENVRMVLDLKRRQGKYIGGSPLYGYRKDPADKNRLLIDPEAAAVVRQIYRWALAGRGPGRIADALNSLGVPSPSRYKAERLPGGPTRESAGLWNKVTVGRMLRNEMYTGVMVQGRRKKVSYKSKTAVDVPESRWFRVEGTHEAIIDRETFQAVGRALALRVRPDGAGEIHPLAGLTRCGCCGGSMRRTISRRRDGNDVCYLRCGRCGQGSIRLDLVTDLVSERVRRLVRACPVAGAVPPAGALDIRLRALERERETLAPRLETVRLAMRGLGLERPSDPPEDASGLARSLTKERKRLEARLEAVDTALAALRRDPPPERLARRAQELLSLERVPRELMAALVEKVEIGSAGEAAGRRQIRIYWKF